MKLSKIISATISLALGISILAIPVCAAGNSFTDVAADAYYADAVAWAIGREITGGTSPTTFSPNETCTRAQVLTFMWRAAGRHKIDTENPFTNLSGNEYYADAAIWAHYGGLITGTTFDADAPCTRGEAMTYLWKLDGKSVEWPSKFADVPADAEYNQAVSWAVRQKITSGTSATTFSPNATCNRGQIVTFLYRFIKKRETGTGYKVNLEDFEPRPTVDDTKKTAEELAKEHEERFRILELWGYKGAKTDGTPYTEEEKRILAELLGFGGGTPSSNTESTREPTEREREKERITDEILEKIFSPDHVSPDDQRISEAKTQEELEAIYNELRARLEGGK